MDCKAAGERLELYVLDGLDGPERAAVRAHVRRCEPCRRRVASYRGLLAEMRSARPAGGSGEAALAARVRLAARAELARARRRRLVRFAAGAAAAAVVAAAGLWGLRGRAGGGEAPGLSLVERWRYGGALSSPASAADEVVVRGGRMYFLRPAAGGLVVVAVDAATGRRRWEAAEPCRGYLAADEERVYCLASAPTRTELVALDAAGGEVLWRWACPPREALISPAAPVVVGGGRLCWTGRRTVALLEAATGRELWRRRLQDGPPAAGSGRGGVLYLATAGALRAVSPASGRDVWVQPLDGPRRGLSRPLLALAPGRAYLALGGAGGRAELICLDIAARRVAWRRDADAARHLLAAGDAVVVRGADVRGYDPADGRELWHRPAAGCGPLTREGGRVCFVDSRDGGRLLAVEPRTGRAAWKVGGILSCDGFRRVGPTGFVKTRDGVIHALALRTP